MTEVLRYAVFAADETGGNPAGVVLDATGLTDADMLAVARDVGCSETAFVVSADDTAVRVRYFSPAAEVPFCGHATVATAVALAERDGAGSFAFDTMAGRVLMTADASGDGIEVSFTSVEPQVRPLGDEVVASLLAELALVPEDLDPAYPPVEAYAGNPHPIITLHDRDVFGQFRFSPLSVARLMAANGWPATVTVLHPLGRGAFEARNLFPVGRITEDPATGSAAAAVGAYLRDLGRTAPDGRLVIRQGAHVGRPSVLHVTVPAIGGIIVTGRARRIG